RRISALSCAVMPERSSPRWPKPFCASGPSRAMSRSTSRCRQTAQRKRAEFGNPSHGVPSFQTSSFRNWGWTMENQYSWTLREILIVAVLGAVFGVLYLAWVQVWLIAQAVLGAITMDVVMGFWFIVSI